MTRSPRPPRPVPTAGMDVQRDMIEVAVFASGAGLPSTLVAHRAFALRGATRAISNWFKDVM